MRVLIIISCFVLVSSAAFAQRYATASGNWNGAIWAATPGGAAGSAPTPTATDDVFTNGRLITVTLSTSCRNLFVSYNVASSITINTLRTLTITGTLTGYDDVGQFEEFPTTTVMVFSGTAAINFTGVNMTATYTPYVIYGWDTTVPLGRTNFTFGSSTFNLLSPLAFGATTATVVSGTLVADPGVSLSGSTATFVINSGATFTTDDPIGTFNTITCTGTFTTTNTITATNLTLNSGGNLSSSSLINLTNNLTVNSGGTIGTSGSITAANTTLGGTINTSNFLNTTTNFTLNSTGILNTSFSGVTQTQAWWSNSNSPGGSLTMDPAGTINFSSSSAQNLLAQNYGNLTLNGTGTITKTLVGTGTLNVAGALTINSSGITFNSNAATAINIGGNLVNSGTWVPTDLVSFNGTGAQTFPGTAAITFSGGIQANKTAGTLTLNRDITTNGITVSQGTLDLANKIVTVSGGSIDNSGTITPSTSTVIISGTTSMAGISSTSLNNLTVNSGVTFTAANNASINGTLSNSGTFAANAGILNINGAFSNAATGTFNANGGTVVFGGSSAQTISGAGAMSLSNITINNSVGVNNNGTISLSGSLDLGASGKFDADGSGSGSFTLLSAGLTTSGGRISSLATPSNFSGNVTIQRTLPGTADWRYLSIPLLTTSIGGTTNVSQWKTNFPVTGQFSDPSPTGVGGVTCASPGTAACASIYTFNAATQAYAAVGSGGTVASTALDYRTGYSAYIYSGTVNPISISGAPVTGAVSIPLSASGAAYNLIPNPYPSPIDWDNVTTTGTTNTVYMTTAQGSFATYVKGGTTCTGCSFNTGWRGELAIGQSFWIQSSGATTIGMAEAAKTTNSATFAREAAPENHIRVTLKSGIKEDDIIVRFVDNATPGLEYEFDAKKKGNVGYINLSSYNIDPNLDFAINSIPFLTCSSSVKLKITDVAAGSYSLNFSELETFTTGYDVVLVDKLLNTEVKVGTGFKYDFSITSNTASYGNDRFELKFSSPLVNNVDSQSLNLKSDCSNSFMTIDLASSQSGINYQFFLGTTPVTSALMGNGMPLKFFITKSFLAEGNNLFTLKAATPDGCQSLSLSDITSFTYKKIVEVTSVTGSKNCGPGSLTLKASGAPADGFYKWYPSFDAIDPISGNTTNQLITENLSSTKDYFVSVVNGSGCESGRMKVTAEITSLPAIASVLGGKICGAGKVTLEALGAPSDGHYNWYTAIDATSPINGELTNRLITETLVASKDYFVSAVSASGCESALRVKVAAEIVNLPIPQITAEGTMLKSSSPSNNQWYKDGVAIPNATLDIYEVKESGDYQVKISKDGCDQISTKMNVIMTVTGIENEYTFVKIYPNPVIDILTISIPQGVEHDLKSIQVFNTLGQSLLSENEAEQLITKQHKSIDFREQKPGIYILHVNFGNTSISYKIVKK